MVHYLKEHGKEACQLVIFTPSQATADKRLLDNYESKFIIKIYFGMLKDWYPEESNAKIESWKIHSIFGDFLGFFCCKYTVTANQV